MKKSLRMKLFIGISSIVVLFVILSWILNSQYLEKYYLWQKKNMLIKQSEVIDSIYKGSVEDIDLDLEIIEHTINADIIILSKDKEVIYTSMRRVLNKNIFNKPQHIPNPNESNVESYNKIPFDLIIGKMIDGNLVIHRQKDMRLKINFLVLQTALSSGDFLILRIPLISISESASIANKFMMFTGLLSIILGSIWAFIFSKRFIKPILELNYIAENMANLDFTKKCSIRDEDEIGKLGNSINNLSNHLDNAISKLHEKNEKLKEDIEKERKIDEMRKEFISSVSHELKTPISLIQGYAEGLKENVVDDEENKNFYCEVIMDEARKMDKLVKDLLNLSQIESGYFKIERTDFNISDLIDHIVNKYKGILEEKGINIIIEKEEKTIVNADIVRIEQIIVNFVNNAINHIDNEKIIRISMKEHSEKIRIYIFNSGKHIPNESLDKIWTSFYKVDKARTRDYGGYGLGLSIVRAIQQLHNNNFGVDNIDKGVTFWFDIDISKK